MCTRGDYENLTLIMPNGNLIDEDMMHDKACFILKHVKKGMSYEEANAWASIWIMVKHCECVYDADTMERVQALAALLQ